MEMLKFVFTMLTYWKVLNFEVPRNLNRQVTRKTLYLGVCCRFDLQDPQPPLKIFKSCLFSFLSALRTPLLPPEIQFISQILLNFILEIYFIIIHFL